MNGTYKVYSTHNEVDNPNLYKQLISRGLAIRIEPSPLFSVFFYNVKLLTKYKPSRHQLSMKITPLKSETKSNHVDRNIG